MTIIDNIEAHEHSATAAACEHAALYGATPERDEFDTRDVWDADDAIDAVREAFRILAQGVGPDGTQLSDERESLLWGFVNMLDAQTQRLDRSTDKLMPDLRDLQREQDGTEIKSRELELVTDRAQNLTATGATRSRPCATQPPTHTGSRPAACGGRGADRTPARPAS